MPEIHPEQLALYRKVLRAPVNHAHAPLYSVAAHVLDGYDALAAKCARLERLQPATVWLLSEDGDADSADAFTAERDARAAAIDSAVAGLTDDDAMTEWQARDRDFAWRSGPFGIELYVDGHGQLTRIRRLEVLPAKQDPATCAHPREDRLLIRDRLTECGLCGTALAYYTEPAPAPLTGGKR